MAAAQKSPTSFRTELQSHGKTATGIEIPPAVVEALGSGKKPAVTVTVNGYSYRNTVAVMGGKFMVGVSAEHRAGAGVKAGDMIDVSLALDTAPRVVEVPDDFAKALAKDKVAKAAYEKLSYSHKRAHVDAIVGAKAAETRARRIEKALAMLNEDASNKK
jgi:Bacteriocin-protection, YdeI or OmpD-Associated/Domain of unknown function (DUF1905)